MDPALACIASRSIVAPLHQRHIPIQNEYVVIVGDRRHRLRDGVTCSELLRLQDPVHGLARERLLHAFAAVSMHDVDSVGLQALRGVEHMRQKRPTRKGLQHLGQIGFHPFALTRGENDDGEGHGDGLGCGLGAWAREASRGN